MKRTLIGYYAGRTEYLKEEYRIGDITTAIEIYKIKKQKTIAIDILPAMKSWSKIWKIPFKKISKKQQAKWDDPNYKVDTTKWVKPDEETIRNELIKHLALCEILDESTDDYKASKAKRDVIYSILYSESPSNPQSLTSYAMHDNIETIYRELDNKTETKNYRKRLMASIKDTRDIEIIRKERKKEREDKLNSLISIDKKPYKRPIRNKVAV